ncbi:MULTISPECIES: hypothetical protein [Streptomyces]|uniref:hypothetical protein n=1 Tax=Streptomyces TaxID=1883 RepID=UPI0010107F4F|nr:MULTISPECIES: hypothetical protein [Streptomyces]MDC7336626.1 hypothetical protein [Streptomyces lydicus]UEG94043.1 hypothetical protein LJ741_27980 [Streptomyces lydicus]
MPPDRPDDPKNSGRHFLYCPELYRFGQRFPHIAVQQKAVAAVAAHCGVEPWWRWTSPGLLLYW